MSEKKRERRAAGTLLVQQAAAVRDLRRSFREDVDAASAEVRRKRSPGLAVSASSKRVAAGLGVVLYESRQAARSAARRRLSAELSELGVRVPAPSWVVGNRRGADERAADAVARSLGAQWEAVAKAAAHGAEEGAKALSVSETTRAMRFRLERAARSEVARAYAEEHREALRDVVEYDRRFRDGTLAEEILGTVVRRWSALADACETCLPLDGEEVGVDDSFPGGFAPGAVHPNCLCCEYLVVRT